MPIHTGTQGALDVFRKDAGGQCENGDAGGVFTGQRTDGPGRVKAIHDRHLYIHEDRGVFPRSGTLKQVHGHLAVLGVDDPQVYVAKQIFKDFSIQSVIFGKEERLSTEEAALLRVFSGCIVFFCRFGALQRDIHGEARSLAQRWSLPSKQSGCR